MEFLIFLLNISVAVCVILRNTFNYDFSAMFNYHDRGKSNGNVVTIKKSSGFISCLLSCAQHKRCELINFHQGKELCELLSTSIGTHSVNDIASGWQTAGSATHKDYVRNLCEEFPICRQKACVPNTDDASLPCQCFHEGFCLTLDGEVYNIAIGCEATMSSVYSTLLTPYLGVDGVFYSQHCDETNIFHTANQTDPWWYVDLKAVSKIYEIKIINRCTLTERAANMTILVGNSTTDSSFKSCVTDAVMGNIVVRRFQCSSSGSAIARFVKIQLNGPRRILHLQEVEVYGVHLNKTLLNKKHIPDSLNP